MPIWRSGIASQEINVLFFPTVNSAAPRDVPGNLLEAHSGQWPFTLVISHLSSERSACGDTGLKAETVSYMVLGVCFGHSSWSVLAGLVSRNTRHGNISAQRYGPLYLYRASLAPYRSATEKKASLAG